MARSWTIRLGSVVLLSALLACGGSETGPSAPETPEEPPVGPQLSDALLSDSFDWPARPFTLDNRAPILHFLEAGDRAVDFTLRDLDGEPYRLGALLADKPVLLVTGSFTCPIYQASVPDLNVLAAQPFDTESTFGEVVQIVHVYVVEAHPKSPDPAPNYGIVNEASFSELPQAWTYADRVEHARRMVDRITGPQLLLIDDLTPGTNNPVWSTYGTGANCAFLIDQDGVVQAAQTWASIPNLRKAIRRILD